MPNRVILTSIVSLIVLCALLPVVGRFDAPVRAQKELEPPIQLHPQNPHYFLFRGKAMALITSGEHYGALFNADFDYRRYLDALAAAGMNYTRLFGGSYVEAPGKSFGILRNDLAPARGRFVPPWARSTIEGYAGGGSKFDLEKWNPEYFSRLHDFLAEASKRGIVVELTFFSSQYGQLQWDLSPFNRANNVNQTDAIDWKIVNTLENGNILAHQERYVRKLVREVSVYPNVIFELANEPWSDRPVLGNVVNPYLFSGRDQYPNSIELADELSTAWQTRVAEWIANEEAALPKRHLIAQNCCNFVYPMRRVIAGVSMANFHYAYPEAALQNYGLGKALSYDETGFLGRSDAVYARQAWNFMLSGGAAFDGLDYSFSVGHEDGTDTEPNGPGGGSAELRRRLRILSDFLQGLPLVDLAPDLSTVKHAGGVVTHMLSSPRGEYAMYVDGDGPTDVTFSLPAGEYMLRWVDVTSGSVKDEIRFKHSGGEKMIRSPEFRSGLAMRLTRK
jgi:hypothetical protein